MHKIKKIAVMLWLYHEDLAAEFVNILKYTNDILDIYVALCEENNNKKNIFYFKTLPNVKCIEFYPNIGADIYSFIDQITNINSDNYDYFIKIHSKKNKWGIDGSCNWRSMLLDSLISSNKNIVRNALIMKKNNYGCIGCGSLIYRNSEHNHKNKIKEILNIINFIPKKRNFIGGNMFMGDIKLYQKYLSPHKNVFQNFLSREFGKVNEKLEGNYSHAIERILGYIGCEYGLARCVTDNFRIKINSLNLSNKFLSFRHMYNDEVYCIEQPNIYGKILSRSLDHINIEWMKKENSKSCKYLKIAKNKYINEMHLSN